MPTINFVQTKEIISLAKQANKLSVAHVSRMKDAVELARQNINGFVHLWMDEPLPVDEIDSLKKRTVFIVPTLCVLQKFSEYAARYRQDDVKLLPFDSVLAETRKLYIKGVPILAGTDAPNFDLNYGSDLFWEIELLSKAGLSNKDVVKAATSNIYKAFELKEFGPLKEGTLASFLMVKGNPLEDLGDLRNIDAMWQNGERVK